MRAHGQKRRRAAALQKIREIALAFEDGDGLKSGDGAGNIVFGQVSGGAAGYAEDETELAVAIVEGADGHGGTVNRIAELVAANFSPLEGMDTGAGIVAE